MDGEKKNHSSLEKKTKAELIKMIASDQQTKEQLTEQNNSCQKELEMVRKEVENIKQENIKLKQNIRENERNLLNYKKIETEMKSSEPDLDDLTSAKKKADDENQKLRKKVMEAGQQIDDLKKANERQLQLIDTLSAEKNRLKNLVSSQSLPHKEIADPDSNTESAKSQKTNIRLEIIPLDKDYRIRLIDILSLDSVNLDWGGEDFNENWVNTIVNFLKSHLPQFEDTDKEKMTPDSAKSQNDQKFAKLKNKRARKSGEKIHNFWINQQGQRLSDEMTLLPNVPFSIVAETRLPYPPSPGNIDIDKPHYGIQVQVVDKDTRDTLFSHEYARELELGKKEYQEQFVLPNLNPGEYLINLHSVVPFAHIGEQFNMEIHVGN